MKFEKERQKKMIKRRAAWNTTKVATGTEQHRADPFLPLREREKVKIKEMN